MNQFDSYHKNHLFGWPDDEDDDDAVAPGCFCRGNSFLSASVASIGHCYGAT